MRILLAKASNDFPGMTYPLGLMYLSAAAKRAFDDLEVRIFDLRLARHSYKTYEKTLAEFKPDVLGLSGLSIELDSLGKLARMGKAHNPELPVIAGGPHPSSDPKGTLKSIPEIDYVTIGEGENTFVDWLGAVREGRPIDDGIAGLATRNPEGEILQGPPREFVKNPDELPWPDYDVVEAPEYWEEWSMAGDQRFHRYANLFTSRACPYKCTYCHDLFGKGFNARSPENVVAEIEHLITQRGIEEFEVLDDIFNFDLDRAKAICRMIIEKGFKIRLSFPNALRTDRLDKELVGLLAQAGTKHISIAVETATPRLQKQIKKNLDLEKVFEMIEECHRHKVFTRGFFMIGFPSETKKEILDTIAYARRSKLTTGYFFVVIPYEGTSLMDENREMVESMEIDYSGIDYWTNHYNMSSVTNKQLKWLQRWAMIRFYASPRRFYYIYRASPSLLKFLSHGFFGVYSIGLRLLSIDKVNLRKIFVPLKEALLGRRERPAQLPVSR